MQRAVGASVGVVTALAIVVLPPVVWWVSDGPPPSLRVAFVVLVAVGSMTLALAAATALAALASRRPAASAGATVFAFATWLFADLQHVGLFRRHLDAESIRLFYQATTTRVIPFDPLHVLVPVGVGLGAGAIAFVAVSLAGKSRASDDPRVGAAVAAVLASLALSTLLGDRALDVGDPWTARALAVVPFRALSASGLHTTGPRVDQARPIVGGPTAAADAFRRLDAGLAERATRGARVTQPLDIVLVHVESLRGDMVTEELMPALSKLRADCISPPRHHSTGNNTGSSIFGLVSGLNGYHYEAARAATQKPLPLRRLRAAGYTLHAHLTGNLRTFDGLSTWLFGDVVEDIRYYEGEDPVASDRRMVEGFSSSLQGRGASPHFDYLVVDSTHYDYSYPKELERFTPVSKLTGIPLADLAKRRDAVKNAYKNSVVWVDALLGDLLARIDASGRRRQMVIVIVGDHGEAFYERRAFGHGSWMNEEETRTAFVLCGPRPLSTRYTDSSHADVMPTLFDLVGMAPPDGPWTNGKSLLGYEPALDFALLSLSVSSPRAHAIVMGDKKVYFLDDATPSVIDVVGDHEARLDVRPDVTDLVHLGLAARSAR